MTRFFVGCLVMLSCLGSGAMDDASASLDDMLEEYAHNSLPTHPRTGVLYNASLPSNFTGIQVSIVRLRRDSFWGRGANYSGFRMPPRIFAHPYFTRLDIVYSNVAIRSSSLYNYNYNVLDHTLAAPVVGFNAYGSTAQVKQKLKLTLFGGPILIEFPVPQNEKAKCVAFYPNGTFEMSNMRQQHMTCLVRDQGHFSMVVPTHEDREAKLWKWLVFGGVLGLLLVGSVMFFTLRITNTRKMDTEALNITTTYVAQTKMPLATPVRTRPNLENDYVP